MDFQVAREPLLRALQLLQNIVEPRQTLPILANVLIEAREGGLRLAATDLEVGARVAVPGTVARPGAITLAARKLVELVRELPAQPVAFVAPRQRRGRAQVRDRAIPAGRAPGRGVPPARPGRGGGEPQRGGGASPHDGRADELRDVAGREPPVPERALSHRAEAGAAAGGHRRPPPGPRAERRGRGRGDGRHRAAEGGAGDHPGPGRGRAGGPRGRGEQVLRAHGGLRARLEAGRGAVPELRAGHSEVLAPAAGRGARAAPGGDPPGGGRRRRSDAPRPA